MAWTKKSLDKKEGILMLILYAMYTINMKIDSLM